MRAALVAALIDEADGVAGERIPPPFGYSLSASSAGSLESDQVVVGKNHFGTRSACEASRAPKAARSNLARILYALITRRVPYDEEQAFRLSPASKNRRILNLHKQAAKLGFQLTPAT